MSIVWSSDKEFEIQGTKFIIDITPGKERRASTDDKYTIVKTKKFVNIYDSVLGGGFKSILELGVFQGGSLIFLNELYRPDNIVGVELSTEEIPALDKYIESLHRRNMSVYYGVSQDDKRAIANIVKSEFPTGIDMIVDDASHLYDQTKRSMEILFRHVNPGGLYIIEDWAWSFKAAYQDKHSNWYKKPAMATILYELIGVLGATNAIEKIELYDCMAIITKSTAKTEDKVFKQTSYRGRKLPVM